MALSVERVDVWTAGITDEPGGLASKLAPLHEAGANLQFVISRRAPDKPGTGIVFVTPLQGDRQTQAAAKAGFNVTQALPSVRVQGPDRPGMAAELTQKLAKAGLNLRGFAASVIGSQFVAYLALDSQADADKATSILQSA